MCQGRVCPASQQRCLVGSPLDTIDTPGGHETLSNTVSAQMTRGRGGNMQSRHLQQIALSLAMTTCLGGVAQAQPAGAGKKFQIVEATIADIHKAIRSKQLTATQLVNMYLARIKAYNGTCVNEPQGILGPVSPIPHAGAINALMTLNLRPAARKKWAVDDSNDGSMTDLVDNDPNMPDALEVAAALDARFAKTGQLAGPL